MTDSAFDRIRAIFRGFEAELALPAGFLDALLAEDDWSFVIKAHALVEAAVAHVLAASLDPRFRPIFERFELSNVDTGKLAFAEAAGLLEPGERKFVQKFSELRNSLVHDVRRVAFAFDAHLKALDKNQRRAFASSVAYFVGDDEKKQDEYRQFVLNQPKLGLWAATANLLAHSLQSARQADALRALREFRFDEADLAHTGGVDPGE
jgi:hypothetical protein